MGAFEDITKDPVQRAIEQAQQQQAQQGQQLVQDAMAGIKKKYPGIENRQQAKQAIARHNQNTADPMNNIGVSGGAQPAAPKPVNGYGDILSSIDELDKTHQANVEDLKKKQARDAKLAAIADGLGALHNIYSRSRGIEPITSGGPSASSKLRERYDKYRADLDKDYSDKIQTHLRMLKMQQDAERAEQAAKHQASQEKYWDEQAKRWANADEVARQKAAADKEHKENQDKVAQQRADTDKAYKESRAASDKTKAGAAVTSAKARQTSANTSAARERRLSNQGNSKKSTTTNKKPTSTERKTGGSGGVYSGFSIHKK